MNQVYRSITVLLCALLTATLAACSGGTNRDSAGNEYRFVEAQPHGEVIAAQDRQKAPSVRGELLDGSPFDLQELQGKIVILNFWASWCAPCRVEAPELEQIHQQYAADGVQVIGILVRDTKDQGEVFSEQVGLTYPSVFDPKTKIALQFRGYPIAAIPSTLVIDRDGKVAAAYVAAVDKASLTATLEKMLAQS